MKRRLVFQARHLRVTISIETDAKLGGRLDRIVPRAADADYNPANGAPSVG
jgi:hypothetical protein